MPNVNYRGKPLQDPNAPPESGVTSIPLGAPWPPLSREQVVKLHEALVEFTEGLLGVDPEDEGNWDTVRVAGRLEVVLRDLGIGRPAAKMSKRTWSHEEVAKVAEEVQQRSGLPRHAKGRAPTTATELAITAALESSQRLSQQQVEELLQATADVPRRQEGQWEEPPKRNCWSCDHDKVFGGGTAHICTALPPRRAKGTGDSPTMKAISAWTDSQTLDASLMPPKNSDGCPGWKPKNETTKRECWTCGSFHINHGCGKKWTASAALAAHLKKMDDMIDGGASTTEVASMDLNCPGWEPKP